MAWRPMERLPQEAISPRAMSAMGVSDEEIQVWSNGRYECLVRTQNPEGMHEMRHLSIHTHDRGPVRNWRHPADRSPGRRGSPPAGPLTLTVRESGSTS